MRIELVAEDFSLRESLECGQAFRWAAQDGAYYGFIGNAAVRATQTESRLTVETFSSGLSAEHVRRYFSLDLDLPAILHAIDVDAQIHAAVERHHGLRVLRQDPWECLASFICSSFNNIKRIRGMIDRLCQAYGEPAAHQGFSGAGFPSAPAIAGASERDLRLLGLGFRAPYLLGTAKRIAEGTLKFEQLRAVDYPAARLALMGCDGVGEKVADCVALFSLDKYEAFPIDVWMERAMRYYFRRKHVTAKRMHTFASRQYGKWAGYAQQYLYHYVRTQRSRVELPADRARAVAALN